MERELLETMLQSIEEIRKELGVSVVPFIVTLSEVLLQIEVKLHELIATPDSTLSKRVLPELRQIEQELRLLWQCTDEACLHKDTAAVDMARHAAPLAWLHAEVGGRLQYLGTVRAFIRGTG